jgi:hypothetical protein
MRDKATTQQQPKSEQPKPQAKPPVEIERVPEHSAEELGQGGYRVGKWQGLLEEFLQAARGYHHQHLCCCWAEILNRVRGATGRKGRTSRAQNGLLPIDLYCDLTVQNIEPLILTGMAMEGGPDIGGRFW